MIQSVFWFGHISVFEEKKVVISEIGYNGLEHKIELATDDVWNIFTLTTHKKVSKL